jgi:hypothetical protein
MHFEECHSSLKVPLGKWGQPYQETEIGGGHFGFVDMDLELAGLLLKDILR